MLKTAILHWKAPATGRAGWALIVSAVARCLTGAFPLVLRRLSEREGA